MRQEIPTWLAMVIVVIVIVIVAAFYFLKERAEYHSLPPLPMKEKMKALGGSQTGPVPPGAQGQGQ